MTEKDSSYLVSTGKSRVEHRRAVVHALSAFRRLRAALASSRTRRICFLHAFCIDKQEECRRSIWRETDLRLRTACAPCTCISHDGGGTDRLVGTVVRFRGLPAGRLRGARSRGFATGHACWVRWIQNRSSYRGSFIRVHRESSLIAGMPQRGVRMGGTGGLSEKSATHFFFFFVARPDS